MNKQKSIYLSLMIACVCLMLFFSGFFVAGGGVRAETTDPDATDPVISYTIKFLDSNTEHTPLSSVEISSTELPYEILYTPTKVGYEFSYWGFNKEAILDTNLNERFIITESDVKDNTTGEINIYAFWNLVEYALTFEYSGCEYGYPSNPTGFESNKVTVETNIDLTQSSYKAWCAGHEFVGWFSDENYSESITKLENVNGPVTLYGKFKRLDYHITFADETLGFEDISFRAGLDYPYDYTDSIGNVHKGLLTGKIPTKEGYTFDGWYTSPTFSGDSILSRFQPLSQPITLYAKWTKTPSQIWLYASLGGCVLIVGGFVWWLLASKRKLLG